MKVTGLLRPRGAVPAAAVWLGGLGLLPFVTGALLLSTSDAPWFIEALRYYAAAILSFMGGIHWGLAMADHGAEAGQGANWTRLGVSVAPALVAWLALLFAPPTGLAAMAIAFALLLGADLWSTRRGLAPPWYPRLRVPLTMVVVICLTLGAWA